MTLAHIAGLPLEEGLLALAPAASTFAVCVAAPLRRVGRCLRRSLGHPKQVPRSRHDEAKQIPDSRCLEPLEPATTADRNRGRPATSASSRC
jgi:hypothetical protein